jgi:hypothetical protein
MHAFKGREACTHTTGPCHPTFQPLYASYQLGIARGKQGQNITYRGRRCRRRRTAHRSRTRNKVARRLSPRCRCGSSGSGSTCLLRYALLFILLCSYQMFVPCYFFRFVHCLLLNTLWFLDTLLFGFGCTFEIDFGQLVGFISAVIILVVISQFVIVITAIIAYHGIFGIRADCIASAL